MVVKAQTLLPASALVAGVVQVRLALMEQHQQVVMVVLVLLRLYQVFPSLMLAVVAVLLMEER
jgi:hypothetical protein